MDYLITFDDGSSAYLEHHGVKGMKWGVRNEETKAKYSASPYSAHRDRRIEKAADRVYKRASEEYTHAQETGKRSKFKEFRTKAAADSYLRATKDSSRKEYNKYVGTGSLAGGAVAGVVGANVGAAIARNTTRGRQLEQQYRSRVAEVRTHALTDVAATRAKVAGSERVSKLLAEKAKRPDVY